MKIGILGGTFDPIHKGHLVLARCAKEQFLLDEVWVMPSANPPHKNGTVCASVENRCEMVKLAIKGCSYLRYSGFECEREGYSYSSDTLRLLHEEYPEEEFYFIIGGDSLFAIETWHEPARVMSQCVLLASMREEHDETEIRKQIAYLEGKYTCDIRLLRIPRMDVSSHELRQMLANGQSAADWVPKEVQDYIKENRLYERK